MATLCQVIESIQHEAAAFPTGELRATVLASLELLTEYIEALNSIQPGATSPGNIHSAANDVLYSALFTALHVQELAKRPADRFVRVRLSSN
jgi:hypothetical protein